jgi:cyclin-dependent kinase-like
MFAEIVNGMPLFPGDSDIDQLFHIINCFGRLSERQIEIFKQNPMFTGVELPQTHHEELQTLEKRFPTIDKDTLDLMKLCLHYEPERRGTYQMLIDHPYFNGIEEWYNKELKAILEKDNISGLALQSSLQNKKPKDLKGSQNNRKKEYVRLSVY